MKCRFREHFRICPDILEIQSLVELAGVFIGIRSGLCDVIREADCRKIALYPDYCYCDTKWANEKDCEFEELTIEEIVSYINSTNVKNVTLTGGEPLLQPEMDSLLKALAEHPEISVEIETNGSISIKPFCNDCRPDFTMDYKLPESGSENDMCLENFCLLKNTDTIKFVCSSIGDLEKAKYIIENII